MKAKLVIFDLDGTLVDTVSDLGAAVNYALNTFGLPTHEIEAYKMMVGNGVKNLVRRAMPELNQNDNALHSELLKNFMEYYNAHIVDRSFVYPGIERLLKILKDNNLKIAVASNKYNLGTQKIVSHFFPDIEFDAVFGAREGFPLKPDPALVRLLMEQCGASAQATVIVGDSAVDVTTALQSGIQSIGVSWGFRPHEVCNSADLYVSNAEELESAILKVLYHVA